MKLSMIYGLVLLVPPKALDGLGSFTPVSLFAPFQASAQLTQSEKLIRFAAMENNEKVMLQWWHLISTPLLHKPY